MKSKQLAIVVIFLSVLVVAHPGQSSGLKESAQRHFTVEDDIEMSLFQGGVTFSPDGRYFLVVTARGLLKQNAPEDTISIWSSSEVEKFVRTPRMSAPQPVVEVHMATYKDGPIITGVQWLQDSSGIAYTAATENGNYRLFRTRIRDGRTEPLTPHLENVTGFAFQGKTYVYAVTAPAVLRVNLMKPALPEDITGKPIYEILSFQDKRDVWRYYPYSELWVVRGGIRRRVENTHTHAPVHIYQYQSESLSTYTSFSLSPDGSKLALIHPVDTVPASWQQYASPTGYEELRSTWKLGVTQEMQPSDDSNSAFRKVNSYQLLNLSDGTFSRLLNAPTGHLFDWDLQYFTPRWSEDGNSLLLPDSFLPLDGADAKSRAENAKHPCVVALDLPTLKASCVMPIVAGLDKHRYAIDDLYIEKGNSQRIVVMFNPWGYLPTGKTTAVFCQDAAGEWKLSGVPPEPIHKSLEIKVKEGLNEPPVLIATDTSTRASRLLWDPNPKFAGINLGEARVITWKDSTGWEYKAGLVLPPNYVAGVRYPLVIQSHGFYEGFLGAGIAPSGFCARELAAAGLIAVQMNWNGKGFGRAEEAANQIAGFESLIDKLNREGLIDPNKVGMIGFSHTVYHTYAALAAGRPRLAAASVLDGVNFGYWQYLMMVAEGKRDDRFEDQLYGAPPFGEGLKTWLRDSPSFNLDKVTAPLLMLEPGPEQALLDWEPYSVLYSLHKPVDMILIPSGEHVESNPKQRLASQGMNVDWFRFWLQGYQDPSPLKADQYARWRQLRAAQNKPHKD
ncbi:MAG: hypothetical protein WA426_18355 [Silvibacterium sp.]